MGTNREQDSSASPPLPIADPAPSFAPADSQFAVVKEDCRCLVSSAESLESNGIVSPAQSDQVSECCCSPRPPSLRLAATASARFFPMPSVMLRASAFSARDSWSSGQWQTSLASGLVASNGLAPAAHCCCHRFYSFCALSRAEPCRFDSNPLHARSPFERNSSASNWRTGDSRSPGPSSCGWSAITFIAYFCALWRSESALPDRGRAMIQASTLHLVVALIGALALVTLALAVFLPQAAAGRHCSESRTENEPELSLLAARVSISEIRDGLIVRRDGSFCAGWECSGIATQFASAERL